MRKKEYNNVVRGAHQQHLHQLQKHRQRQLPPQAHAHAVVAPSLANVLVSGSLWYKQQAFRALVNR